MEEENWEKLFEKNEYEYQHFKFAASAVTFERKYVLRNLLQGILHSAVNKLTTKPEVLEILKQQTENVVERIFDDFKEPLAELQKMDEHNFTIPRHVLLPHDHDQIKQYTEQDEHEIDEKLAQLKQKFLDTTLMIAMLETENSDYNAIDTLLTEEEQLHEQVLAYEMIDLEKIVDVTKQLAEKTNLKNI